MNKAVFLDRDGVLNEEIGNYVWTFDSFKIVDGIIYTSIFVIPIAGIAGV